MKKLLAAVIMALLFSSYAHAQTNPAADKAVADYLATFSKDEESGQAESYKLQDLNDDGKPEITLVWTLMGPTYWRNTLTVFSQDGETYKPVSTFDLDGEAALGDIKGNIITVNETIAGPNDPICCPTVKKTASIKWDNGALAEMK